MTTSNIYSLDDARRKKYAPQRLEVVDVDQQMQDINKALDELAEFYKANLAKNRDEDK